jgi:hypothetical protein
MPPTSITAIIFRVVPEVTPIVAIVASMFPVPSILTITAVLTTVPIIHPNPSVYADPSRFNVNALRVRRRTKAQGGHRGSGEYGNSDHLEHFVSLKPNCGRCAILAHFVTAQRPEKVPG